MFIRKQVVRKGDTSRTYLKLVENYRKKGKVLQRTLVNFGNISHWPKERVRDLIYKLSQVMEIELPPSLEDIEHKGVLNFGQPFALGLLWNTLQLGETLQRLLPNPSFVAPIKACEEFLAQFHLPPRKGKTKDPVKIRLRIGRFLRRKRVAPFFRYSFDPEGKLTYNRHEEGIGKEALLDGLFIIRTNSQDLSKEALGPGV